MINQLKAQQKKFIWVKRHKTRMQQLWKKLYSSLARSDRIFKLSAAVDWHEHRLHLPCPAGELHQNHKAPASRVRGQLSEFQPAICSTGHGQLAREQWSHPNAKNLEAAADPRDHKAGLLDPHTRIAS